MCVEAHSFTHAGVPDPNQRLFLQMIYAFVITCLGEPEWRGFPPGDWGRERERERSIKKAIDHRRENDPDTHLHCVVVERHLNVCIVLTGSRADALIS